MLHHSTTERFRCGRVSFCITGDTLTFWYRVKRACKEIIRCHFTDLLRNVRDAIFHAESRSEKKMIPREQISASAAFESNVNLPHCR